MAQRGEACEGFPPECAPASVETGHLLGGRSSVLKMREIVHRNPVWRERSNFILAARIEPDATGVSTEQLWGRQIDERHFELCCIPFFAYNLSLGDIVETDGEYLVSEVCHASGRYVLRVWFGDSFHPREDVAAALEGLGALLEWSSLNLLAVDACDQEHAQQIADYLQECEELGWLLFEKGRDGVTPGISAEK